MATVNKNFRVKDGLIVEGTTGTINGNNILTDADTTSVLAEGTNLYYTNERVDDRVANLVSGGTGITITYDDNGNALGISTEFSEFTTSDIVEGTNLYFTNQRAIDAVGGSATSDNTPNTVVKRDSSGSFSAQGINIYGNINNSTDVIFDTTDNSWIGKFKVTQSGAAVIDKDMSNNPVINVGNGTVTGKTITGTESVVTPKLSSSANILVEPGMGSKAYYSGQMPADEIATLGDIDAHAAEILTHGVSEAIVGTTDTQTLTNKTLAAGTSLAADLDAESYKIINLGAPTQASDAATKAYVDDVAQGLHVKEGVDAATTDTLATLSGGTVTYDNGTAGVGATLTLSVALTILDGHTLIIGDRVLVKNEAEPANNGIYVVTSSTVLTRDPLFDSDEEIEGGDFVFVVEGTENGSTGWVQSSTVNVVGTDDMVWIQFSGAGTYSPGVGLDIVGTEFSVDRAVVDTWYDAAGSAAQAFADATDYADTNFVNIADLPGQLDDYIPLTQKAAIDGVATLDSAGNVPVNQLGNSFILDLDSAEENLSVTGQELSLSLTPTFTEIDVNSVAKKVAAQSTNIGETEVVLYSFKDTRSLSVDSYGSAEFTISSHATVAGVPSSTTEREVTRILLTTDNSGNIAITEYGIVALNQQVLNITAVSEVVGTIGSGGYGLIKIVATSAISGTTVSSATIVGTLLKS